MTTRMFRVTVRGVFDSLTEIQRGLLLADAADHDILRASYTPEGHLTYDLSVRDAFAFRFLATGEAETDAIVATERAEAAAAEWLTDRDHGCKNLRSQVVDLALAPLGKRQRKAAIAGR
ncbi:hypothetical protein GCM10009740_37280 [Terrabacter terrae]|uniref:Uncharacterized protein n=1 Tax=Terrabacter terrae TaxID=318434 RepID=A0ABN2UPU7_9MICO